MTSSVTSGAMIGASATMAFAMIALLVATLAVATRPWWRGSVAGMRRRQANVAAYRIRLVEIEAEFAAGAIASPEAMEVLKQEAAARLLAEAGSAESAPTSPVPAPVGPRAGLPARLRVWAILLVGAVLAVFAGGGYWLAGSWRAQAQIAEARRSGVELARMVQELADKLKAQPDNSEGWALLGRSYFAMQRFDDAAKAYAEASSRESSANSQVRAEWFTDQGEALAFASGRDLNPAAIQLFEQALTLDPDNGKALWYAGLSAASVNDTARARMLWGRLAKQDLPAAMREALETRMAQLADSGGIAAATAPPAAASEGSQLAALALHLHVSLAPALAGKIPAEAKLLVFAKAEGGPPMPLAVQRLVSPQLPVDVVLDDSEAMTPALKLSLFDRYVVTARLSSSGMAQAASGDLQGSVQVVRADADHPLQLTIDSVVP